MPTRNTNSPGRGRVLLLEDDPNLGFILQEHLQLEGFEVTLCADGVEGLKAYRKGACILLLVDIMMPAMDGFTFARRVRSSDDLTPIIFLTARSLKEDKVEGFRLGCDDYVTKPFSMEELMLRIRAVLRRASPFAQDGADAGPDLFDLGMFVFDQGKRLLRAGDTVRKLTDRESELLRMLCLHKNRVLERDVALRAIWGNDSFFSGRSMDVFISRLRRYLAADPAVEILNIHGRGYKLVESVRSAGRAGAEEKKPQAARAGRKTGKG
jgi:two-component system response regulator VicR